MEYSKYGNSLGTLLPGTPVKFQGLLWLVVTLIQLVDQSFQASQLNQTKRLVGVWLTDFYLHTAKQTGKI